MKMPNLPSRYQSGTWNVASESHRAANGPRATTASTSRTAFVTRGSSAAAPPARQSSNAASTRTVRVDRMVFDLMRTSLPSPASSALAGRFLDDAKADVLELVRLG